MLLVFLSSGLFLGWSLGANDAANVFGSAVGTRMVRFKTAAILCGIFVILGAVFSGAGTSHTIGSLGSVNALAGAFMVALSAAFTVYWMTRLTIPVSTSQAIVGAIIGWNFFSAWPTDTVALKNIMLTWLLCPVLSGMFAVLLFLLARLILNNIKTHLLRRDLYLRVGLLITGAFGAYSLGANNIANVMGVFVTTEPLRDFNLFGLAHFSGTHQLFLIGGIAIAVGAYTYSRRVMETVGGSLLKLTPEMALIVVLAHALVLFIFSSENLEYWLISSGLPSFPLVPVSSSQAIVGAILGVGILKGWRNVRLSVMGGIAAGWIITPVVAGLVTFIALFFLQNVFSQEVSKKTVFVIDEEVLVRLNEKNIKDPGLNGMLNTKYENAGAFTNDLLKKTSISMIDRKEVFEYAHHDSLFIDEAIIDKKIDKNWLTPGQIKAIKKQSGKSYSYPWKMHVDLENASEEWQLKPETKVNKLYNKSLMMKRDYITRVFRLNR